MDMRSFFIPQSDTPSNVQPKGVFTAWGVLGAPTLTYFEITAIGISAPIRIVTSIAVISCKPRS